MKEQLSVELWEEIRIRRTDRGWDFYKFGKEPSVVGLSTSHADTFDRLIIKIKDQFDIRP